MLKKSSHSLISPKSTLFLVVAAVACGYQAPTMAQTAPNSAAIMPTTTAPVTTDTPQAATLLASPWTANLTLASQYVSRGFRQTWGKPAIQGGIDYTHPSGWSAGTWMSSVSDHFIENGTVEWDLYGGYSGTVGDVSYSGLIYYYLYPGAEMSFAKTKYNYGEAVASATYKWLNVKYWLTYTPTYFGYDSKTLGVGNNKNSQGSGYLDLNGNFDLSNGYNLLLHYGYERVQNFSAYNFQDTRIAVSKVLDGGWTLTGAYTKGWAKYGIYAHYTTGALNSAGVAEVSNPLASTFLVSVTKTF